MYDLVLTATQNARRIMQAQAINANNLANVSTTGFKTELAHFTPTADGGQVRGATDFSYGTAQTTGRQLDVAIDGDGWFAVIGEDGREAYTRRGDLQIDSFGQLTNGAGFQVLGDGGPVALPPFSQLQIAADGSITILPLGQTPNTLASVDRIKLVRADSADLYRGDDGLMRRIDGDDATSDATVRVVSGVLEGSNVNAAGQMIRMIELARQFEAQVQLMRTAQENERALSSVLSMN